jgi:hypothetical protein
MLPAKGLHLVDRQGVELLPNTGIRYLDFIRG